MRVLKATAAALLLTACASEPAAPPAAGPAPRERTRLSDPQAGDLVCQLTPTGGLAGCELSGHSPARLPEALRAAREEGLARVSKDAAAAEVTVLFPLAFDAQGRAGLSGPVREYPVWLRKPTATEVAGARRWIRGRDIAGRATFRCTVATTAVLTDCSVVEETPHGHDIGKAALTLTPYFRLRPGHEDGVPVAGGTITVPVVFQTP